MEALLIFDIGKTNKKVLLFDRNMKVIHEENAVLQEVTDEEGFPCDDAQAIEGWIKESIDKYLTSKKYLVRGINISTYGATLVYLDEGGKRLTPIYNYLKPLPEEVTDGFFEAHDGQEEFCRQCASPMLGMLNSGLQLLWMKRTKPDTFRKISQVLHLPQYLAKLVHGQSVSELTSIGCHTMLWDFDRMEYHSWLKKEGISLPDPVPVSETFPVALDGGMIEAGIGIHDSSASLAPYILSAKEDFILISTGTWCINMNPFNSEPLTAEQLRGDCLSFMGVHGKPVLSSRFFLGRIHDLNVERLQEHFFTDEEAYKRVDTEPDIIRQLWESGEEGQLFFRLGIPVGMVDLGVEYRKFGSFEEAYSRLMVDLSRQVVHAIGLIIAEKDSTKHLYITGGFAKNNIFRTILSLAYPEKQVFTSEVDNASSLGAALVMADIIWEGTADQLDLGLSEVNP
ncbi:MAG: FGGY family carbohydrate kinase [Bacteroidota bacterium]|nr:FGGY family carbohydrate kinase [Bacteroidota bacterium]